MLDRQAHSLYVASCACLVPNRSFSGDRPCCFNLLAWATSRYNRQLRRAPHRTSGPRVHLKRVGTVGTPSQVDSVNEFLFSLHLNSDLYTKLTFTQLALLYEAPAPVFVRWLFLLSACRALHHKACVHCPPCAVESRQLPFFTRTTGICSLRASASVPR